MSYPVRLLITGFHDCYYNMGLDEALLESVAAGAPPVLRFYGWNPPAVSVGYFQGLAEEVDEEACRRQGFDLVRRISGGGAVLHKSELTYSIVLPLDHPLAKSDLHESYRLICSGLLAGFKSLGIEAVFSGINDILSGGKKISGNAQTRRLDCLLQHGTVILDNDLDIMFSVLRVPQEKIRGKLIEEVRERVGCVKTLLGRDVPFDQAVDIFADGFRSTLDLDCNTASFPLPHEEKKAQSLAAQKFASKAWIYKR